MTVEYEPRLGRIPIRHLTPQQPENRWPSKAFAGEVVPFGATVFREGHDVLGVHLIVTAPDGQWTTHHMVPGAPGTDRWHAEVVLPTEGLWSWRVRAFADEWATWLHNAEIKIPARIDVPLMVRMGADLLARAGTRKVVQDAAAAFADPDLSPESKLAVALDPKLSLAINAKPLASLTTDSESLTIRVERTRPDGHGGAEGTGEFREIPVQSVYRAVGYFGSPLDGIPFDDRRGVVPNREGQVVDDHGEVIPGVYATGWIKRGPVGLIGHTKSDAMETIGHLVNGQADWWSPEDPSEEAITELLASRGVAWTDLDGWHRLDQHEIALGEPDGRARIKVVARDEMVRVSRGE